jgi:diaminopimelate epimerase
MTGAGNDFVLLTGAGRSTAQLRKLAVKLCSRRLSVGADGLLYVNGAGPGAVSLRYFNSDGSEAFCGNGSRCAALWARRRGLVKTDRFLLKTLGGALEAEITAADAVRMAMPDVPQVRLDFKGAFPTGARTVHFLNTGVPHAVVPVADIERTDVRGLGSQLRRNKAFGPAGTNVDFVMPRGRALLVRTFERGVEDETLACGTGIAAAAVAMALSGKAASPVTLLSRGGDRFRVSFEAAGRGARRLRLEGPARMVFEGEIEC